MESIVETVVDFKVSQVDLKALAAQLAGKVALSPETTLPRCNICETCTKRCDSCGICVNGASGACYREKCVYGGLIELVGKIVDKRLESRLGSV